MTIYIMTEIRQAAWLRPTLCEDSPYVWPDAFQALLEVLITHAQIVLSYNEDITL